ADIQSGIKQYQSQVEKLSGDLSSAQTERFDLEEKIKTVSLQASSKGRDPLKWRIAEIEYLLALANHRLILSQDYSTALTALQDADQRLRRIADPGLTAIRRVIASEVKSLESVQPPDIAGMALKLSALGEGISQLPLVNRERLLTAETSGLGKEVDSWQEIPSAIWRDVKGLVTVRRNDMSIERILPPDELHYLSQNLGLKIEQARLALLRKDTELFRSNLKDTGLWVGRYFDQDTASVKNVVNTVNELLVVDLNPPMPDISASLRELRLWRESQASARLNRPIVAQVPSESISAQTSSPVSDQTPPAALAKIPEKPVALAPAVEVPSAIVPPETAVIEQSDKEIATTESDSDMTKQPAKSIEQSTIADNIPDAAVEKAAMDLPDPAVSIDAAVIAPSKPDSTSSTATASESVSLDATLQAPAIQDPELMDNAGMIKPETDQSISSTAAADSVEGDGANSSPLASEKEAHNDANVSVDAASTNEGVTP
ncbi:MAG: uroporphyrinogen-III C-methyltransferase, partial [Thiohalomonadales bacterium]